MSRHKNLLNSFNSSLPLFLMNIDLLIKAKNVIALGIGIPRNLESLNWIFIRSTVRDKDCVSHLYFHTQKSIRDMG